MKKKKKTYCLTNKVSVNGGIATVLLYGELWEDGVIDGIRIQRVGLSRDGRKILEEGPEIYSTLSPEYSRTKYFNMGWSICAPGDKFDKEEGIKLARRRFHQHPLTTKSGTFLTDDMINAIMENEINFIITNFGNFYCRPRREKGNVVKEACEKKAYETPVSTDVVEEKKANAESAVEDGEKCQVYFNPGDYVINISNNLKSPEVEYDYYVRFGRVAEIVDEEKMRLSWEMFTYKVKKQTSMGKLSSTDLVVNKKDYRLAIPGSSC